MTQPNDTDLTFKGVALDDDSFSSPQFYGIRGTYWFPEDSGWGIALDFTHPKAIADESQVVHQSGRKGGVPVDGDLPISTNLQSFELSHGHNLLTVNAMHRWFAAGERNDTFLGRLQPYVGAGVGAALPHTEATVDGVETSEYQVAGWTLQGLGGINFDVVGAFSLFLEYKLNWADVGAKLEGGGKIRTEIWTHQFILGGSLRL